MIYGAVREHVCSVGAYAYVHTQLQALWLGTKRLNFMLGVKWSKLP